MLSKHETKSPAPHDSRRLVIAETLSQHGAAHQTQTDRLGWVCGPANQNNLQKILNIII